MSEKVVNPQQVQVQILGQYIKDSSFSTIGTPEIFTELTEHPKVEMNLDIKVVDKGSGTYEVILDIKAKALKDISTVFTVDIEYAGLFKIVDEPTEEQKQQILMVYCPNLIFPFARAAIANITREGGFMPLAINPVDFSGLYLQKQKQDGLVH